MKKVVLIQFRKSNCKESKKSSCKDRDKQTQILGNLQQIDVIWFERNGKTLIAKWQEMSKVFVLSLKESYLNSVTLSGLS